MHSFHIMQVIIKHNLGVCLQNHASETMKLFADSESPNGSRLDTSKTISFMMPVLLFNGIQEEHLKVSLTKVR